MIFSFRAAIFPIFCLAAFHTALPASPRITDQVRLDQAGTLPTAVLAASGTAAKRTAQDGFEMVIAPNGVDIYVTEAQGGLTHLQQNISDGALTWSARYPADTNNRTLFQPHLSHDGRFLTAHDRGGFLLYQRNPASGALDQPNRFPSPFSGAAVQATALTANQDQLLFYDESGRIGAWQRDLNNGHLSFSQTVSDETGYFGPIAGRHGMTISARDELFVVYQNGTMAVFDRDNDNFWNARAVFSQIHRGGPNQKTHALVYDDVHSRLWLRGDQAVVLYEWDTSRARLHRRQVLETTDNGAGPLLFQNSQVWLGAPNGGLVRLEQQNGRWQPAPTQQPLQFSGPRTLALNPQGPWLLAAAPADRTVTVFYQGEATDTQTNTNLHAGYHRP